MPCPLQPMDVADAIQEARMIASDNKMPSFAMTWKAC